MRRASFLIVLLPLLAVNAAAQALPRSQEKPVLKVPDFGAELRAFDAPHQRPVPVAPDVIASCTIARYFFSTIQTFLKNTGRPWCWR